jgi:hypothetical protein
MATPENLVKSKIKALLKKHGAYYTMPVMTGMATNGTPDFSIGHAGRYLAVEAKAGAGIPTELQWVRLKEVERAGCSTMVINENNLQLVESWLQDADLTVQVVREMDSRRVLHHWTNKGVM